MIPQPGRSRLRRGGSLIGIHDRRRDPGPGRSRTLRVIDPARTQVVG